MCGVRVGIVVFGFGELVLGFRCLRSRYLFPRLQTIISKEPVEETFSADSVTGVPLVSTCSWGFRSPLRNPFNGST